VFFHVLCEWLFLIAHPPVDALTMASSAKQEKRSEKLHKPWP
jgi:hypothetical protein